MEKSNLTRIIIEYLNKKGLSEIGQLLEKESKITIESEIFHKIKILINEKNYEEAISEIIANYNQKEIKLTVPFIRINQIFNCILEDFSEENIKNFNIQQKTLSLIRNIISKTSMDEKYKLHKTLSNLACLLFIEDRGLLIKKMKRICPIALSNDLLFEYLSNLLCHYNKNLIGKIHSKNLNSIINKVYKNQISNCLYHNVDDTQTRYSFFKDHSCSGTKVPYKHLLTIDEHNEEVLNIVLSNDNEKFAVVLKSNVVLVFRICYEIKKKKLILNSKRHKSNNKAKSNSYYKNLQSAEKDLMDITDGNNSNFLNNSSLNNRYAKKKRGSGNSNNIELKSDKFLNEGNLDEEINCKKTAYENKDIDLDSDEELSETNLHNFKIEPYRKKEYNSNIPINLNNINFDEVKKYSRKQNKSKKELDSQRFSQVTNSPCSDIFKSIISQEAFNSGNKKNNNNKIFCEGNIEKNITVNYNFLNERKNSNNSNCNKTNNDLHGKNLSNLFENIENINTIYIPDKEKFRISLSEEIENKKIFTSKNNSKKEDNKNNILKIYQISKISAHKDMITSISFSSDSSKILTSSKDKSVKLHEVKTGKNLLNITDIGHMVTSAQFHCMETQILCTSLDSKIHIYSIQGVLLDSIPSLNINEMLICEKFNLIILSAPILRAILIYDIQTKAEKNKIFINDTIINISLSRLDKGENLLINSSNLTPVISLWKIETNALERKYFGHRQERLTTKCCFGGFKEKFILCGSDNKEVFIWNRNNSLPVKVVKLHSAPVNAAVWPTNEKSDFLFSVSDDHTIKVIGNENIKISEFIQGKFFDENINNTISDSNENKRGSNRDSNMIIDEDKEGIKLIIKVMILFLILYLLYIFFIVFLLAKEVNFNFNEKIN